MTTIDLPNPAGATKVYDWVPPEVTAP